MKFVSTLMAGSVMLAESRYQQDAPAGRWLNNERPPNSVRSVPEDSRVACPTDKNFCIDYQWSDSQTCLSPNPHLIKRCMDEGCIRSPFGQGLVSSGAEDTYCKDFMSVEGRFCQWTEMYKCNCPAEIEDIVFANGIVVPEGGSVPAGYRVANACVYPTKNMKRMPNGAYVDVPVAGELPPPPIPNDPKLQGDPLYREREEAAVTTDPVPMGGNRRVKGSSSVPASLFAASAVLFCVMSF